MKPCFSKSFLILVKSNQNQNVSTISRLILNQTKFRLVRNQSQNSTYNLIPDDLSRIRSRFVCVYDVDMCQASRICFWKHLHAKHRHIQMSTFVPLLHEINKIICGRMRTYFFKMSDHFF